MPGPQRMSGEAFAIERLREDPDLDYAALRRQAADAGVSMMPIQYGRARKQLGLPPLKGGGAAAAGRDTDEGRRGGAAAQTVEDGDDAGRGTRDGDAGGDGDGEDIGLRAAPAEAVDDDVASPHAEADDTNTRDAEAGAGAGGSERAGADLVAPRRKGSAAFDFLVQELRREPNAAYATLRDRSAAKGWKVAPIMYGRAKAVLGLVPVKPRGAAKKNAVPPPPRTLRQVESVAADRFSKQLEEVRNLDQLVAVVRELDAERRRLRDLLDRIVAMIDEALGG